MHDESVTILENARVNEKYFKLIFRSGRMARGAKPGQFVQMQINPSLDPFLRRPFSFYRIRGEKVEILYEILGKGTAILSRKTKGESLRVLGPLGNTFTLKLPKVKKRVLVAGGVGVPPLIFLAEHFPVDEFLIGAKSKKEVLPKAELHGSHGKVTYATNDGSYGAKGFVTVLLEPILKKADPQGLWIQTCGPKPMMQAVMVMAKRYGVNGQASVDETMGCGVGVCLGCMVKTKEGWLPSCTRGPVFSFEDINYRL